MQDSPGRKSFGELGTAATIDMTQAFGGLPTRNFQEGQFEEYENLNGNTIKQTLAWLPTRPVSPARLPVDASPGWATARTSTW